jgi:hypothetical protein
MNGKIYRMFDPYGNTYKASNLQEFCDGYNKQVKEDERIVYDGMRKACKNNKEYRCWIVEKIDDVIEEPKKIEIFGLTPEEKILTLSEENSKLKSQIKESLRNNSIYKDLAEVIQSIEPIKNVPQYIPPKKNNAKIEEDVILFISDAHADQIIKPERVNGLEDYNFHVACKRGERIVDVTVSHLLENMPNYTFETLHIFLMGDLTSGEIHGAKDHSETKNALKNGMIIGELLTQMIMELSQKFKNINIICLSGNHGRKTKKKDYRGAHDNFDFLVGMYIKTRLLHLIEQGRIAIEVPDSWSAVVTIKGYTMVLNHGDSINSFNGLPWYGIERKTRRITSVNAVNGVVPNYFFYGHFHQSTSISNPTGETFINGSWNATDEYALEGLGAYTEPTQLLMGVHENHGCTWRMPIKLRVKNWKVEEKKPTRYKIDIF